MMIIGYFPIDAEFDLLTFVGRNKLTFSVDYRLAVA